MSWFRSHRIGLEVILVHELDRRRFGDDQIFVTPGKILTAKVIGGQILALKVRPIAPSKTITFSFRISRKEDMRYECRTLR